MPIHLIKTSGKFERRYKRLPPRVKELEKKKEIIFRADPFAPQLKTHKLQGRDKDSWAFYIDYKYRIKFIFISDTEVLFIDAGTHNEVY